MTRYENWRELAEECRSSGMSVHGWCLEKGIPNSTCRQWIAKLKEEEGRFPKPKEVWGMFFAIIESPNLQIFFPRHPWGFLTFSEQ